LDPSPLIVRTPIERLSILPVGRERARSAELFSTKEMTRLIQSLGRRFADSLLILDAPPCLSTSDPAVLAQVVGQILFVVQANRTQREEIEASLDLIQSCPTITMVLNKQQISSRYTFGAYSSYYSS
jgi:protein-tyrosine kinase